MPNRFSLIVFFSSILVISFVNAAPSILVIDDNQERTGEKYIFAAHKEIPHNLPLEQLRFVLLDAAIGNLKIKWLLEEEGENYTSFRWDYRGNAIIARVEFDPSLIQIKYENAFGDYVCENNVDGICYENNDSDYYSFMKRLRTSLILSLSTYQGVE